MATLHLICGVICSGKTTYARHLMAKSPALLLSVDEITLALSSVIPPESHDSATQHIKQYLLRKAMEALAGGMDVIFDWGFWRQADRTAMTSLLTREGIQYVWHYIDVPEDCWERQIAVRNEAVRQGDLSAYYVDEGLKAKCLSCFEPPIREEMDIWYVPESRGL